MTHSEQHPVSIRRLCNRVRKVREERGMPMAELARRAGIHRNALERVERNPDGKDMFVTTAMAIAAALDKNYADLFWIEPESEATGVVIGAGSTHTAALAS